MNMKNMEEYHESGNKSPHTVLANKNETCKCLILRDTTFTYTTQPSIKGKEYSTQIICPSYPFTITKP